MKFTRSYVELFVLQHSVASPDNLYSVLPMTGVSYTLAISPSGELSCYDVDSTPCSYGVIRAFVSIHDFELGSSLCASDVDDFGYWVSLFESPESSHQEFFNDVIDELYYLGRSWLAEFGE